MSILCTANFQTRAEELVRIGQFFHQRNWAPATSGNYSARVDNDVLAITVSGAHKGQLSTNEIMAIRLDASIIETPLPGQRPSAETELHTMLYRHSTEIGAVLHSHSAICTVMSMQAGASINISGYEMQKAIGECKSHEENLCIPIFDNEQNIPILSAKVEDYLKETPNCFAYLIRGHGLYTWGRDISQARRHTEGFEFILECEQLRKGKKQ